MRTVLTRKTTKAILYDVAFYEMFTSKGLLADDICLDGAAHFDLSPPGTTIMWRYQVRFSDMEKTIASA